MLLPVTSADQIRARAMGISLVDPESQERLRAIQAERDAALEDNLQLEFRIAGLTGAVRKWERRWVWAMFGVMVEMLAIVGLVIFWPRGWFL